MATYPTSYVRQRMNEFGCSIILFYTLSYFRKGLSEVDVTTEVIGSERCILLLLFK